MEELWGHFFPFKHLQKASDIFFSYSGVFVSPTHSSRTSDVSERGYEGILTSVELFMKLSSVCLLWYSVLLDGEATVYGCNFYLDVLPGFTPVLFKFLSLLLGH